MSEEQDQLDYEYQQLNEVQKEVVRKQRLQTAFIIIGVIIGVSFFQWKIKKGFKQRMKKIFLFISLVVFST